jgi:PEP-CTERM motif
MWCSRLLFPGILLVCLAPSSASADPIVIIGGSVTTDTLPPRGATFSLLGADGSIDAAASCGFPIRSCAPGTLITPNARFFLNEVPFLGIPDLIPIGTATINGVTYPPPGVPFLTFNGDVRFTGGAGVLPATPPSEFQMFVLNLPFSFSGVLNGYDIFRRDPLLLFSSELEGSGTAHLRFTGTAFNQFSYLRTEYEFEPVPEPATLTMMLIGTGAALFRRRLRRRR